VRYPTSSRPGTATCSAGALRNTGIEATTANGDGLDAGL